jgi:Carboxypeptidase regulatory-like domain
MNLVEMSQRRYRALLRRAFLSALILVTAAAASAQSSQLSGTIDDSSHARISGVTITLTHTETGEHRQVTSNSEGFFTLPLLEAGHYEVRAEKAGFQIQVKTGLQVLTGQTTEANFILAPGAAAESVEVSTDGEQLLQVDNATISSVIENQTIVNLPLLDRRAAQLQRTSGFVVGAGTGVNSTFAIGGGRGNNANYVIDGGTSVNLIQGVETLVFDMPIDALQEFNLSVSNYSADSGQSGGGVVQMTTKSGTDQFHGSAYLYYRSNSLQAVPVLATHNPPLDYKLFGGSIGGPILRGKTHFFFTYEGKRQTSTSSGFLSVPDALERTGDFSQAIAALDPTGAQGIKVIDPNTANQAVGDDGTLNKLPSAEIDPYGKALAAYYPLPNVAGAAVNKNNFSYNDPARTVTNDYVARIDHVLGSRDNLYGRFLGEPGYTDTADVFPTRGTDGFGLLSTVYYYSEAGTWTHTFKPSLINEISMAFTQRESLPVSHGVNAAAATTLGLPGVNPNFFPGVNVAGLSAIGNTSQQERLQVPILSNAYDDNLSWTPGNHSLKFGVEYRTSADGDKFYPSAGGIFGFIGSSNISSNQAIAGLTNLMLGRVDNATRQETEYLHSIAFTQALYAQDNWRVNSKLTLNLGLRWDRLSPRFLDNNHQNSFNTSAINPVSNTPGVITFAGINGQSKYANNFDNHLFGPRVGFAWSPSSKTVIRGGGSILYPGEYDAATPVTAYTGFSNATTLSSSNSAKGLPAFQLSQNETQGTGQAFFPTTAQLISGFGAVPVGSKVKVAPQFYKPRRTNGYIYQVNLDVQRELPRNLLFDVAYVGSFGHHLVSPDPENINQITPANLAQLASGATTLTAQELRPFPQFGNVSYLGDDVGASKFNGLNIGINKRYSHDLQYQLNYTWSHFLDNQDSRNELAGYPGVDAFTNYYDKKSRWGNSGNDVRNRVVGNVLYDLPIGRGRSLPLNNPILDRALGNWTIGGLGEIHSGTSLSVTDLTNNTGSFSDGVRPNLVGNPNDLHSGRSRSAKITEWFDTSAFAVNPKYTFGNAPRTFGRGPALLTADASLIKKVPIVERQNLELRIEALNVFNHASLGNPNTQFGSPNFGVISSLQSGGTPSRTLQLAAHYTF